MELHEDILFLAFRYALGRQTYVVGEVADTIVKKWPEIGKMNRTLILKEIREAIERDRAGHEIDVMEWKRILELEA